MSSDDTQGPAGPAGRQGEAGVSGRQGEAGHVGLPGAAGDPGEPGAVGEQGTAGDVGPRGHVGPALTRRQLVVGTSLVLFVFVLLSVRQEIQQRSISRNQQTITHNQQATDERIYRQCVALNVDLAKLKLKPLDCGPPP